jgi:CheY-like chemotaxis protein
MAHKVKILVVDDQTSVVMMLAYLLTHAGCDVQAAWNGENALRLANETEFDLITLDISMPGMDGFEVCRLLKENPRLCHIPVVFVSGQPNDEDRQHAFELGAEDYIIKPFEAMDFTRRIISHAKLGRRNESEPHFECARQQICNVTQMSLANGK